MSTREKSFELLNDLEESLAIIEGVAATLLKLGENRSDISPIFNSLGTQLYDQQERAHDAFERLHDLIDPAGSGDAA